MSIRRQRLVQRAVFAGLCGLAVFGVTVEVVLLLVAPLAALVGAAVVLLSSVGSFASIACAQRRRVTREATDGFGQIRRWLQEQSRPQGDR